MQSLTNPEFWRTYVALPPEARAAARKAYRLWKENPPPFASLSKARALLARVFRQRPPRAGRGCAGRIPLVLDRHPRRIRTTLEARLTRRARFPSAPCKESVR